jgi:hypothetical protein
MSRNRGAIKARVLSSVVGGRSPRSSTSKPLSSFASLGAAISGSSSSSIYPQGGQPFVQFTMMNQQNLAIANDKYRDGKINLS